jgi:hypothetical protein
MLGDEDRGSDGDQMRESSLRLVPEVGLRILCAALPFFFGIARSFVSCCKYLLSLWPRLINSWTVPTAGAARARDHERRGDMPEFILGPRSAGDQKRSGIHEQ